MLLTSASEIYKMLGRDPKAAYPIDERIAIQEAILYGFEQQYKMISGRSRLFVADRTPIDLAGYLLADVARGTFEQYEEPTKVARMVNDYVARCIEATNRWFSVVVLVQPGIALVEEEGKAPACPAYMEHLNATMAGLMMDDRLMSKSFRIHSRITDLDERVAATGKALAMVRENDKVRQEAVKAGVLTMH